jgi:ATP-dependent DNA helicase RecG
VGEERGSQLARLKIHSIEDLLLHRPRRYEDRREFKPLAALTRETPALSRGRVVTKGLKRFRRGARSVFELILEDATARLHCRWWNLPFMESYFSVGDQVVVYGKLRELKPRTMDHPETEVLETDEEELVHMNRIVPIYPLTEGVPQRWLRGLIWRTLERHAADIREPDSRFNVAGHPLPGGREDPANARDEREQTPQPATEPVPAPSRANAIQLLHRPESMEDPVIARQRLALDELVVLQQDIRLRRLRFEARSRGLPCRGDNHLMKPFLASLGFRLTQAQTRVLREIRNDMGAAHPMRRLLQGDVGSGKTAVAACTALMTLESGFRVLLMAPTEILAEQHFRNFRDWFEPLGIDVQLRTGNRDTANSGKPANPSAPRPTLIVGTHALIEAGFAVEKLGLVVVDEQHKFGVTQREDLVRKGNYPHLLVMTATPIPRTLGLTLYGDLDLSIIDELPEGRGRIRTFVRSLRSLPKVWSFVREQLDAGRQAYVVYPRVDDTAGGTTKAAVQEQERIQTALAPHRVGLLHGRLKSAEKEAVMSAFRARQLQVLAATSLIEVGLDVPNATVMVIENAEHFGLAQLHQLRGRIGRGAHESHCILVSDARSREARHRLRVLEETTDGFVIAEADLKLRGPGELLGQQQSGSMRLRFADLTQDAELVRLARDIVVQGLARETAQPDP